MKAPHKFDRDLVDGDCRLCGEGPRHAIHGSPEKYIGLLFSRINVLSGKLEARDAHIDDLEKALKDALKQIDMHNGEYEHVTPSAKIEEWEKLVK